MHGHWHKEGMWQAMCEHSDVGWQHPVAHPSVRLYSLSLNMFTQVQWDIFLLHSYIFSNYFALLLPRGYIKMCFYAEIQNKLPVVSENTDRLKEQYQNGRAKNYWSG